MPDPAAPAQAHPSAPATLTAQERLQAAWRLLAVAVLGFASGLPLALTGQALQAWLSQSGVDIATIGFLSLVGLPYTFKFLWAPLMDRFDPPWLGRRRGWLVLTQLLLAAGLWAMSVTPPQGALQTLALLAVAVAFLSASQDVAVGGYQTDLLAARERGMGASLNVMGYRLAMIVSGGIALIWTDALQGGGWTWPEVYRLMAAILAGAAVFSAVALPRLKAPPPLAQPGGHDLKGFLAVLAAAAMGYLLTDRLLVPAAHALLAPLWQGSTLPAGLQQRWGDLLALLAGIALTVPLGVAAARWARFETLRAGLASYFAQSGAVAFLVFIVLYKLGDAFAGALMTPFLLKSMAFAAAEVGLVNKVLGLWLTILGALAGGALMLKLGLWRALMLFGVLQAASNLGFWWLATHGQGALGAVPVPAFDWGFVKLAQDSRMDGGLILVVALENLTGGMGTAAFVAFLMSLTSQRFSATQFALLSALASVGRVWVGPMAGVVAESIGWPDFFVLSTLLALPALGMLWWLRPQIQVLEADPTAAAMDD
ncbi:AmpG family muropeptide MFS transporter [Ideonella alba]|uniref:MFS transporter n=1 Tax=Ideonella alba TaxID=2824118 RepID=A0A940YIJ1_9BURK|nr:MFS transporter [Ideonella alba]MBQ0933185.1 MFS transporter [Ideonella alba]